MIPVAKAPEPDRFDAECRVPGKKWLAENPEGDPHRKPLWRPFTPDLREAFRRRCGFLAMWIPSGTVDHWISTKTDRDLAYEWSNYRFLSGPLNSAKKPAWEGKLLDPFEVREGWFELLLPSLELVPGPDLPPELKDRAKFTLEKLGLGHGEDIIRLRREWMEAYERGDLLDEFAPLLARAIRKRDATRAARDGPDVEPG